MSLHLLKYYRPHNKSLPIIESPPQKSLLTLADNLPAKIRSARAAARRDGFLLVNCRPGGDFSGAIP